MLITKGDDIEYGAGRKIQHGSKLLICKSKIKYKYFIIRFGPVNYFKSIYSMLWGGGEKDSRFLIFKKSKWNILKTNKRKKLRQYVK